MDKIDRQILRILQTDSSMSVSDVAKQVGLSASPCWKRINRLTSDGIIKRRIAVLNADILGFGITAYVSIRTGEHSREWLENFSKTVTKMPEVMEFHRMAGDVDYMLKVMVTDMQGFDAFYKRLISTSAINEQMLTNCCRGPKPPQRFRTSHCCVPVTATFTKRPKIGAV